MLPKPKPPRLNPRQESTLENPDEIGRKLRRRTPGPDPEL